MERTATILRIEKISVNDGYGLRTVVFFKGCPLRCAWCSTPESQRFEPEVYYQRQKCVQCGRCVSACPAGALSLDGASGAVVRDTRRCKQCLACVNVCLPGAQNVYGKQMTVKDVMRQIQRDEVFFFHSGGGVTLSGGDVLCQAEFARDLLRECKESGIHTMAELDLFGDYERVAMLLPYLDAFFVDLKLMDPVQHKKWTGVDNATILANLRRSADACKKNAIHVRVPLIWGINDSWENLTATAAFCQTLPNCAELEFLPYHRLGQVTYEYLSRDFTLSSLPTMTVEDAMEKVSFLKEENPSLPIKVSGRLLS